MPKRFSHWKCSGCQKKRQGGSIEIDCFDCRKTIQVNNRKVDKSDYYICGTCFKNNHTNSIDILREPEQVLICKLNAAGEMWGFDIREPNAEQIAAIERAKYLRDCGLAQMKEKAD